MIEIKNLIKTFSKDTHTIDVLKGLDLKIERGESLGILGISGAGKSTLINILGTLDHPTSGTVHFEDVDVFAWSEKKLAAFRNAKIGFVFQFYNLLPEFNALENVMMPALIHGFSRLKAAAKAEIILNEVGLGDRMTHKPGELSGGEQQRIAVARALINEPKVVLADEPTGNLDTHTGKELFKLLLHLNEKKEITFVIVTHNESLSRQCHRVLEMVDGKFR